jgi:hypothetical protein
LRFGKLFQCHAALRPQPFRVRSIQSRFGPSSTLWLSPPQPAPFTPAAQAATAKTTLDPPCVTGPPESPWQTPTPAALLGQTRMRLGP